MTFDEIIGLRIKDRRTELGLSQAELAKKLGYSGKSMVSLIETGKRSLNASQIGPLAKALECSIDDLVDGPQTVEDEITETLSRMTDDQKQKALQILRVMISDT